MRTARANAADRTTVALGTPAANNFAKLSIRGGVPATDRQLLSSGDELSLREAERRKAAMRDVHAPSPDIVGGRGHFRTQAASARSTSEGLEVFAEMVAIATLVTVLFLSLIIVRVASEALILTGMSRQAAQFQARSAWTGTGFTTAEAEQVVTHPVRRQIISTLMFLRGVGVITAASTLMLSFVNIDDRSDGFLRFLMLIGGVVALWFFARSQRVGQWMSRLIVIMLKRYTDLDTRDYAGLLHLAGEYGVLELKVREETWLAGQTLEDLKLPDEGVLVLGIVRPDGSYVGAPVGGAVVRSGDTLLLYGRSPVLASLGGRRPGGPGDAQHRVAAREEQKIEREQSE